MSSENADPKMGRPEWAPTKADRQKVAVMRGGGMEIKEIALHFGVTPPTLTKHCKLELSQIAIQKKSEMVEALFKAGKKGNVSAIKRYLELGANLVPQSLPEGGGDKPDGLKPAAMGKKEQANADAVGAATGTDWEDLLPGAGSPPVH